MTEPAPFPEEDAAAVIDAAKAIDAVTLGTNAVAVTAVFDSILQLLGDPGIPSSRATQWGEAQKTPSTVADGLNTKLGSLDAYWQGGAFDAFKTHTDRIIVECDLTAAKLGEVGTLLAEAIAFVHETWGMAIGFITRAAASCISLLDIANPFAAYEAIKDLLNSYADLLESALVTMGEFAANVKAIEISALSFPAPGTLPSEVSNPDRWVIEPAPEHPPEDKKLPAEAGMGESQGGVTTPEEPDTAEAEPA
ncbi:hypothetical protein DMC64_16775 [Amycolatopsis sp. WAC 04197]|uniref:hypothetical protein n=1 Tax=Amycolatopsis TaxID=1813 RepID=UPI000F77E789|nr:hypothetical protein [Amycolatopsis sp. WAC 04197]RSN44574.1 hypothetical protein DMC64_16775 [Amycolatopsis sp. WAC 04197]